MTAARLYASAAGTWWLQQWQASLPEALRAQQPRWRPYILLEPDEDEVVITFVDSNGRSQVLARHPWSDYSGDVIGRCRLAVAGRARRSDVVLALAHPHAIRHMLLIPRQARAEAERIVHEHVLRKTPLAAGEFLVAHHLVPTGKDKLALHFLVVPQKAVAERLSRLGLAASGVDGIQAAAPEAQPPVRILLSDNPRAARLTPGRVVLCLLALAVGCAFAGYAGLAWRQQALLQELEAQAVAAAGLNGSATARARSVAEFARDMQRVNELRQAPGVVRIWDELARLLPATTYLTEVDIQGAELRVKGLSADAAALIQLFETSPLLSDAGFLAPLVVDRAAGREQFSLRATLRKPRPAFGGSG